MMRIFQVCGLLLFLYGGGAAAQEIIEAARAGDLARVRALVEADAAQLEVRSATAKTPLTYAAQGGHLELVAYLIGLGADPNARNVSDETPLLYAAYFGHEEVVAYLLAHGADPNVVSGNGDNPLDVADMQGAERIVSLLEAGGAVRTRLEAPEVLRVADGIHKIAFPYGEAPTILVCSGDDGLLLVDTGWRRTLPDLRATLQELDARGVVAVVNTHEHEDHVEGNAIAGEQAPLISLARLDELVAAGTIRRGGGPLTGRSGHAFASYCAFDFGGQEIRLIPAAGAHTDGDLIVHFTGSNVVDMGDLLILQSFPSVTEEADRYLEILATVLDVFPADTILIAGHGKSGSMQEVADYHRMLSAVRDLVVGHIEEGWSNEEILKDPALAQYAAFGTFIPVLSVNYWVEAVCRNLRPGE
jgi:glyoxylase-like metal-dependent hydrolase (beta-lactamase superfamily II)